MSTVDTLTIPIEAIPFRLTHGIMWRKYFATEKAQWIESITCELYPKKLSDGRLYNIHVHPDPKPPFAFIKISAFDIPENSTASLPIINTESPQVYYAIIEWIDPKEEQAKLALEIQRGSLLYISHMDID